MRRGAWVGALGGAVVTGAVGALAARSHARHQLDVTGKVDGTGRTIEPARSAGLAAEGAPLDPAAAFPPWPDVAGRRVVTSDGLGLHVEQWGDPDADLTVVFVHGYGLTRRSWRFQRVGLAEQARLVFYDQRSHGASARSPARLCTIDQLGADLQSVLDEMAGERPVVLVGHSMGGMTVLALAERAPELFGKRVVGVALLATSAGRLSEVTLGLPRVAGMVLRRVSPQHLVGLSRGLPLLDAVTTSAAGPRRRGGAHRSLRSSVVRSVVERFSFGADVDPRIAADVEAMLTGAGADVLAAFAPTFLDHDKLAAVPRLAGIPTTILVGEADLMTPVEHSRALAGLLPDADLQVLPRTGHMLTLERPNEVNAALQRVLARCGGR